MVYLLKIVNNNPGGTMKYPRIKVHNHHELLPLSWADWHFNCSAVDATAGRDRAP